MIETDRSNHPGTLAVHHHRQAPSRNPTATALHTRTRETRTDLMLLPAPAVPPLARPTLRTAARPDPACPMDGPREVTRFGS